MGSAWIRYRFSIRSTWFLLNPLWVKSDSIWIQYEFNMDAMCPKSGTNMSSIQIQHELNIEFIEIQQSSYVYLRWIQYGNERNSVRIQFEPTMGSILIQYRFSVGSMSLKSGSNMDSKWVQWESSVAGFNIDKKVFNMKSIWIQYWVKSSVIIGLIWI